MQRHASGHPNFALISSVQSPRENASAVRSDYRDPRPVGYQHPEKRDEQVVVHHAEADVQPSSDAASIRPNRLDLFLNKQSCCIFAEANPLTVKTILVGISIHAGPHENILSEGISPFSAIHPSMSSAMTASPGCFSSERSINTASSG